LDDARKSAQSLAAAAGVKVGAIRYVNDSAGVYAYAGNIVPVAGQRSGDFSALGSFLLGVPSVSLPASTQYTFYLNVVFATVQ
jgi:hypothetical protein